MLLQGRVAIVTGAARGIGQEYSLGLAREGAKVVVTDVLSCEETASRVRQSGGEVLALKTEVTNEQSARAMVEETVKRFGRIDVLVNNAGIFGGLKNTPFEQLDEAEWDRVMAVNVKGLWQCCKAVTPVMRKQAKGKIINIASGTFWLGVPYLLHYVSSKGAVIAFTRALARELSGSGINVNAVTPGFTMTDAAKGIADRETFEQFRQQIVDLQIIKRSEEPRDLVGTIVFLASDASDFISGQTINCDGGAGHH
ncbi:MAG TPA: 3-oxoacyl-ACP reductase family protein [Candidatus Binataceae bacterium]|nr:3-oxoacyl-ACP reductase family protein [Candidatus Binataceae bacterium]